jgi:hypothetical protein
MSVSAPEGKEREGMGTGTIVGMQEDRRNHTTEEMGLTKSVEKAKSLAESMKQGTRRKKQREDVYLETDSAIERTWSFF